MINSWKSFFIAVEQMREIQKVYFRTKSTAALHAARKCEVAVDAAINQKRSEWEKQVQPELIGGFYG